MKTHPNRRHTIRQNRVTRDSISRKWHTLISLSPDDFVRLEQGRAAPKKKKITLPRVSLQENKP